MDDLALEESRKYRKAWKFKGYRKTSPSEILTRKIFSEMRPDPGASIIDLGCGTGRTAQLLKEIGFTVHAIDIASNCLDPEIDVPFTQACLWSLPDDLGADYGICCDVMEHMPPSHASDALACIAKAVAMKCFFSISFQADNWGRATIGKPLHLTIQPQEWWHAELLRHFKTVDYAGNQGASGIFIASH